MNTYKYTAQNAEGTKVNGVVDAMDEFSAVQKIKASYPIVLSVDQVKDSRLNAIMNFELNRKVDSKALSVMCSQFAIILKSGAAVDKCISMIAEQTKDKKLKTMLEISAEDVGTGVPMSTAFRKNCPFLPATFLETLKAGEMSGTLEDSFKTLETYFEKNYKTEQKIKGALTYPIFVVVLAIVVLIVVMIFVIPTIAKVFTSMGGELPLMTQFMISASNFFARWWLLILGVILAIAAAFMIWKSSEAGKFQWAKLTLKLPIIGNILTLKSCEQFADTMSTLLSAGLPVSDSLEVTGRCLDNIYLGEEVEKLVEVVEVGQSLGRTMKQREIFPSILTQMTAVGEETGELESTLKTIGDYYTNEFDYATQQALAKLEPTMMIGLAIFAGFIVISIYLPMFTMYNLF